MKALCSPAKEQFEGYEGSLSMKDKYGKCIPIMVSATMEFLSPQGCEPMLAIRLNHDETTYRDSLARGD